MKILRNLAVGTIMAVAVTGAQATTVQAQSADATSCSAFGANSLTVTNETPLLSHDEGGAVIGPIAISVPAGSYNVSGVSYDDHTNNPGHTDQTNETWYVEGLANGEVVYTSAATDDLADADDYNMTVIGNDVAIPELDAIQFVHNAHPDPLYQSVIPSCVNFEEIAAPVAEYVHTCEVLEDVLTISQTQVLLSHDEGGAFIGPVDVTIPAGTYTIAAVSHDNHSTHYNDPTQTQEQWYFEGYFEGALVYTSNTTDDLPDNLDVYTSDLGQADLPAIDQIRYVHASHPNGEYHSVTPSCIHLTTVDTGELLGETDENTEEVNEPVANTGGGVLGAGDTLANTGASTVIATLIGGFVFIASLGMIKLSRNDG